MIGRGAAVEGSQGSLEESTPASQELTAVILTLNEASNIADCVSSLAWADRTVVFDAFSADATTELAGKSGAEILQSTFDNYAQQRNAALNRIDTDWVFFVDADERGTPQLHAEIRSVMESRPETGWYVPRHNYIFGRLTRGAGWYPDYQLRLFRQGTVRYERPVHEIAIVDGEIGYLQNALLHYNYADTTQFHQKQRRYTDYDAQILLEQGITPRIYSPLTQMLRHFWWRFVTLRGYHDGLHGLRLSAFMAYYEWLKYRKLARLAGQTTSVPEP